MIIAVVGSGGKTTRIKNLAAQYRREGKTVLVTTSTHMFIEEDTLLTDDPAVILRALQETGYAMAGLPDGMKICPLSPDTFAAVSSAADVTLVEADGSRCLSLKYPADTEPVIPAHTDEIHVVCGLNAIGCRAKDVCHRLELVLECLGIDGDTPITRRHVARMLEKEYLTPLAERYPRAKIVVYPDLPQ
jgi:xanthine dehydrogenase accessory factor